MGFVFLCSKLCTKLVGKKRKGKNKGKREGKKERKKDSGYFFWFAFCCPPCFSGSATPRILGMSGLLKILKLPRTSQMSES